jgi:hypothetical protein
VGRVPVGWADETPTELSHARVTAQNPPSGARAGWYSLDGGEGRTMSMTTIRYGLCQGVQASGAGELVEDLRRLRTRYGGGQT